jgi:hypothetical protein
MPPRQELAQELAAALSDSEQLRPAPGGRLQLHEAEPSRKDPNYAREAERLAALLQGFAREAAGLHDAAGRAAGGLHGHDRSGTARFFPLLCCSVAILELPAGEPDADLKVLTGAVATLKAMAKVAPDRMAWCRHQILSGL